jgi:VanZ family protein
MNWNKPWLYATIFVFIGITILSLLPPKSGVEIQSNDKINHFIAYATFAFCGLSAYIGSKIVRVLLFCVCYGLFMEWMQGLVPGREQSLYDALANALGVAIGWTIFRLLSRKKQVV